MQDKKIKVAIIGIGNCASTMVQGMFYYDKFKDNGDDAPGIMNWDLGGYTPADVTVVAAFDVDRRKIGLDVTEAIFAGENNAYRHDCELYPLGVPVLMGPVLDGVGEHTKDRFQPADLPPVDVGKELIKSGADMVLCFLPTGSDEASDYYADQAINVAKIGWLSGMPSKVAKNPKFAEAAKKNKCPIVGDDVKSQLGGTITHRALIDLMNNRGITIGRTYQVNYAGNGDFANMVDDKTHRLDKKHVSKEAGVTAFLKKGTMSAGAGFVENMEDRKTCVMHFDSYNFGGAPVGVKLILEVEDSPNFAGTVIEAVRYMKIAKDRGIGGVLPTVSAFCMKSPPEQIHDTEAIELLKAFIKGENNG